MVTKIRPYPTIARRFEELGALQMEAMNNEGLANRIRTEAYQDMRKKLSLQEQVLADDIVRRVRFRVKNAGVGTGTHAFGESSAWELIVAVTQAMDWQDYPKLDKSPQL